MLRLHLPDFEGPLDLLLQLIERRDLDISELSLVQVADQFMGHVDALKASSVRTAAGDPIAETLAQFLAIGGRLMLLKSRRLLPGEAAEEPAENDPGRELVEMIEEHRRYRDAVQMLRAIDRSGLRSFRPGAPPAVEAEPPQGLPDSVTLDLLSKLVREALARAETRSQRHPEVALARESITVEDKIAELEGRLSGGRRVSFRAWIGEAQTRTEVIVTFMAILELYKSLGIEMQQDDAYGDIIVVAKVGAAAPAEEPVAERPGAPATSAAAAGRPGRL